LKTVLLRAPLLSYSGYGVHSRQIFRWLMTKPDLDVRTQILEWGNTSWMINPDYEGGLCGEIMKRSNGTPDDLPYDISYQVQLPDEWDESLGKFNVGISAFVETDKCNPEWLKCVNKMDSVIVPTTHIKKTIQNTGETTTSISVVPEAYIESIDNESINPLNLEIGTKFNFLIVSQLTGTSSDTDRKNLFNTVKWMCDVFKNDKNVGIILKTNSGRGTRIDRALTYGTFQNIIKEARSGEYPKFHILHGNMSSDEIAGLYKLESVKALVSLTRGEGFGLPILEAAASGIPVVVTNWSGHLDFLGQGKFIPIDYKLIDVHKSKIDNRIFTDGLRWADPIEQDFKRKIKKFREKPDIPIQWAKNLREKIKLSNSQDSINNEYDKVFSREIE